MHRFGRLLQWFGLAVLPLAIVLNFVPGGPGGRPLLSVWQELLLMVFGAAAFWLGRLLEGYARR